MNSDLFLARCFAGFSLVGVVGASRCGGFSGCRAQTVTQSSVAAGPGSWVPGARAQGQQLRRTGFLAPQQVGSSQSWIEPTSSALAGGFFTNWATREALQCSLNVVHDPQKHWISKSFFKIQLEVCLFCVDPREKLPLPQGPMRLRTHPGVPCIASSGNYLCTLLSPSLSPLHPWGSQGLVILGPAPSRLLDITVQDVSWFFHKGKICFDCITFKDI